MAQERAINVFYDPETLGVQVASYRQELGEEIVKLAELGGGALRFAGGAFPEAGIDNVYAQYNKRESEGRGPHFDIYNEGLSEDFPWLGVYNLAGSCAVKAAVMPDKLSQEYARLYPEPTEEAYEARRHFGALVLESPASEVHTGTLKTGTGLVLPQSKTGPHIVHEIVPEDPADPGAFIKMVVPKQATDVLEQLSESGFMPLDELLTKSIAKPGGAEGFEEPDTPTPLQPPQRRGRRPGRSGRDHDATSRSSVGDGMLD